MKKYILLKISYKISSILKGDIMNYKSLEHFRYNISKEPCLGRIIYSTNHKIKDNVKTQLDGCSIRYYNLGKKNRNNKNNRNFSY